MELHISMIPSPEDLPWMSDDYQSGLRSLGQTLRADGLELHEVGVASARAGCAHALSGEWTVELGAAPGSMLGSMLGVPVGSWLRGRHGRTVHLAVGEIEADVRTADELVGVIRIARCYEEVAEYES